MKINCKLSLYKLTLCQLSGWGEFFFLVTFIITFLMMTNTVFSTSRVEIDSDGQALAGIASTPVKSENLTKTIRTSGKLVYNEALQSAITLKFEGWIDELLVNTTGQRVQKGDAVARIYSPDLIATQEEWIRALNWRDSVSQNVDQASVYEQAKALAFAGKIKLFRLDLSADQIDQIAFKKKALRTITVYSPVSGVVTDKMVTLGSKVMPGDPLVKLADTTQLGVMADIYESDIKDIRLGQVARISILAFPGKTWQAKLSWISPAISEATRTLSVRFVLDNKDGLLKSDMLATIEIQVPKGSALTVPESAVIDTGLQQLVYVDKGEGEFEPRKIIIGDKIGDKWIVKSGLKAGEKVVSSGTFLMDSEAQLRGIKL